MSDLKYGTLICNVCLAFTYDSALSKSDYLIFCMYMYISVGKYCELSCFTITNKNESTKAPCPKIYK